MARLLVGQSFYELLGRDASAFEIRGTVGQAMGETGLGSAWSAKIPGARNSNNMGAITAGAGWVGATFEHRDSRPVNDPPPPHQEWYVTKFRSYPTALDGMKDLVTWYLKHPPVAMALKSGSVQSFCAALYDAHYYTGFRFTRQENIDDYARRVNACIVSFNAGLAQTPDELLPLFMPGEWQPRVQDIYQFGWQELLYSASDDMLDERDNATSG